MTQTQKRLFYLSIIVILLLIASAVRLHQLGAQSFWYDEGVAYGHSQRSLAELIPRLRQNVHVPAYFGTLALYEDLVGASEFALRSLSVWFSLISIAGVYALGRRLFHPIAGLAAAAFTTLNTFSIYYAQETRMYAMLAAVSVLSMWLFVAFVRRASRYSRDPQANRQLFQAGLALGLMNAIGEHTHVSYALVMVAQGVMAVFWLASLAWDGYRHKTGYTVVLRAFVAYVGSNVLALVLFAPWIPVMVSQVSAQPNVSEVVSFDQMMRLLQGWFGFGITFEATMGGMGAVLYALLVFGLITVKPNHHQRAWWGLLLPIVWVLLSSAGYLYLGLYERYLRFLLPTQLALALWMGRGVWALWYIVPRNIERRVGWQKTATIWLPKVVAVLAVGAYCIGLGRGLGLMYDDPRYQRDDYRSLAQTIERESGANDAIILSAPGLQEIFGYYYRGDLPIYALPASPDIVTDTQAIINQHATIFAVLYGSGEQDPQGLVVNTLNTGAYPIVGEWVGDVRLERFASPAIFSDMQSANIRFGDSITLAGYALSATTVQPNSALQLQFNWVTDTLLETRYKVFVQLLNSDGVLVAQRDSEPAGDLAPTTAWQVGEVMVDNHALAIPADLPAGDYTLIIGLYDLNNPESRLSVGDATFLRIGQIVVEGRG